MIEVLHELLAWKFHQVCWTIKLIKRAKVNRTTIYIVCFKYGLQDQDRFREVPLWVQVSRNVCCFLTQGDFFFIFFFFEKVVFWVGIVYILILVNSLIHEFLILLRFIYFLLKVSYASPCVAHWDSLKRGCCTKLTKQKFSRAKPNPGQNP